MSFKSPAKIVGFAVIVAGKAQNPIYGPGPFSPFLSTSVVSW